MFNKVASLKVTLLHGSFSRLLSCTNGTKSRKGSQLKNQYFKGCFKNTVFPSYGQGNQVFKLILRFY